MFTKVATALTAAGLVFSLSFAANAVPRTQSFYADPGTEHKLATVVGVGGADICVWAHDAVTGAMIPGQYRRSHNGHTKDLDRHVGRKCFTAKTGAYVLYGVPVNVRTRFVVETEQEPTTVGGTFSSQRWESKFR